MEQMKLAVYLFGDLHTQVRTVLSEFKQMILNIHSWWIYLKDKINYKDNINDNHITIYISRK